MCLHRAARPVQGPVRRARSDLCQSGAWSGVCMGVSLCAVGVTWGVTCVCRASRLVDIVFYYY